MGVVALKDGWLVQRLKNSSQSEVEIQIEPVAHSVFVAPGSTVEIHYPPCSNPIETSYFEMHSATSYQFWAEGSEHVVLIDGKEEISW